MLNLIIFSFHLVVLSLVTVIPTCSAVNVTSITYNVVQRAARDGTTRSITFLSSGYSANSVSVFNKDVKRCVDALYGNVAGVSAAPWNRYVSLFNIYSLFQGSEENTVIEPNDMEQKCNDGRKCNEGIKVNNNLGCSFGIPDPSVMSCNLSAVFTLATIAPAKDLIVVLVNKPNNISSASGNSLAIFTNEPSFLPFFAIRELSKAVANLSSEFNHGINEDSNIVVPNCAPSLNAARQEWGYWMTRGEISETPTQGCFFNNYYRPTKNSCIMRNSTLKELCPICKEQVNLALLNKEKGISLSAGRCPKEDFVVNVDLSQDLQLTVGDIGVQVDVLVVWRDEEGNTISKNGETTPSLLVSRNTLITWTFPKQIIASVEDNSPYVRPEKRTELFKGNTTFYLVSLSPNTCNITNCGLFKTCTSCSGSNCSLDVPPNVEDVHWAIDYENTTSARSYRIVAYAISAVAILLVAFVFLLYYFCYYKHPHEVISPQFMDQLLRTAALIVSIIVLSLSTYILIMITLYFESYVVVWKRWIFPSTVTGALIYLIAVANLGFVLFRCFKLIKVSSVILFVIGILLIGVGLFLGWIHLNRKDDNLIGYVASCWSRAVQQTPLVVHSIQSKLKCSGFFVSCLEVTASYCPKDSESNMYANACETPFMDLIASTYVHLSLMALITGVLLLIMTSIGIIYTVRFSLLLVYARKRRQHRMEPHAPTLPFTLCELAEARRLFNAVADKKTHTLSASQAAKFLQCVFNTNLKDEEVARVESSGTLTFEELMAIHFPYVDPTRIDPRQLIPDEVFEERGVVGIQKRQYSKVQAFADASGTLAPATLLQIYQKYVKEHFIAENEKFLTVLRAEAEEKSPDAPLCSGLGVLELEGLRNAWVQLNPAILGDLSDEQIDVLYQWTHGKPLRDAAHFKEWKHSLDVRNRGAIGWGEFCYPFAKRARLRKAREYLSSVGKEIPPEMISRSLVEQKYGIAVVESVFLIYENEVPIERLIEYLLLRREAELKKKR
ncbi:Peptidase M64 [Trypanosoma melophagium]|uniref:Peptidase M64 n=1 Tax=Trypanosoma melophagium TaxID=715481 RepID=UPI00351AA29B|nr:Peptidase M64 [Trypanosoma melophagium]